MVLSMRAAVYYSNDDIRVEEFQTPAIGLGELLLEISLCGICGSDVMEWYRVKTAPRVLGHEAVGVISDLDETVDKVNSGDRVFVSHHVPCDTCRHCLRGDHTVCHTLHNTNIDPGGMTEYARVPSINVDRGVFPLPPNVTDEEGVLIEPLGCVIRGQDRIGVSPGDSVLVLGSGVSGILHTQLAKSKGATRVLATDVNEHRLAYAEKFGADAVLNATMNVPKFVREENDGNLSDHVIVSTAAVSAIQQAFNCVEDGGRILLFAPTLPGVKIPLDLNKLWSKQVTVTTTYAASPSDLTAALELIRSGQVNVRDMVTHRLSLDETGLGFRLVAEAGESLKIVVDPHS
jgi:L-iditol 2-dehydrogenase